jgi:hypothetical protein
MVAAGRSDPLRENSKSQAVWGIKVASEKQIAANRKNARSSRGPKTVAGKLRSSRNALRHGLSRPLSDCAVEIFADSLVEELTSTSATGEEISAAKDIAWAELELRRIRDIRGELIVAFVKCGQLKLLKRLAALQRYDRFATTRRKRALSKLDLREDSIRF